MSDENVDFEKLKLERRENRKRFVKELVSDFGLNPEYLTIACCNIEAYTCYCDCPADGPCEHEFAGWRAFEDGNGGEQVCSKCGMGAMGHSMNLGD